MKSGVKSKCGKTGQDHLYFTAEKIISMQLRGFKVHRYGKSVMPSLDCFIKLLFLLRLHNSKEAFIRNQQIYAIP